MIVVDFLASARLGGRKGVIAGDGFLQGVHTVFVRPSGCFFVARHGNGCRCTRKVLRLENKEKLANVRLVSAFDENFLQSKDFTCKKKNQNLEPQAK